VIAIRSAIYLACLAVTVLLFGGALALVGWALPLSTRNRIANGWGRSNLWLQKVVCGLGYRVEGWDNLPERPCVVMAKHQSAWETIALRGLLPPNQCWILKRELMWVPVFGWAMAVMRQIAIDRKAGTKAVKQVIREGKAALDGGRYVVVFPEGTRTAPGERKKYGIGGAMLAERSGYPVLPIAHNAGVFWRRRGLHKYPGTIDVVVGPLVPSTGRKAPDILRDVEEWIEGTVARLPQERSNR
jgi:1-acyl-sn-glycerol-3-phosphate acyltransferase